MAAALDTAGLLALLDEGDLVLLPNVPAAGALRSLFDDRQHTSGRRAWEPPSVLAWKEWTESLWSALILGGQEDRILLNRLQEATLWAEVITGSAEGAHLTDSGARELAALARSGLELAAAHEALHRVRTSADSPDARAFANWQATFRERCHTGRLLPRSLLEAAVTEHLRSRSIAPPRAVHLAGFDRLTPAQQSLLGVLRSSDCTVVSHGLARESTPTRLRRFVLVADPHQELRWAVRWIREHIASAIESSARVALVLPDPAAERTMLEPLLREMLAPELEQVGADLSSTPWQFGSGAPLASLSIVQHALLLLRWAQAELPLESVGSLLLSPYLAHTEAFEERARFEMHGLRRSALLRPELSLEQLLSLAGGGRRGTALRLPELQAFGQLAGHGQTLSGSGSHADWAELIRKMLRSVGWPGPRTLTGSEFAAKEAWESLLDLLATLDGTSRRVTFAEVLGLLERETLTTPAPASGAGAVVRIARLDELEGCTFNATVLLHATDTELPPLQHAHPLLAWGLQRDLALPGTDPAHTLARTREALQALTLRCGQMLLVSAAADEAGPLRPSPLVEELGFLPVEPTTLVAPEVLASPLQPELAADATPLPPLPSLNVGGGARLLELQAACGFRAFAEMRLCASRPESKSLGLDARESGRVLHSALEFFWNEVKTQAALKAYSASERHGALARSVTHAFTRLAQRVIAGDTWTEAYLGVLQQRLHSLLGRWLEFELQRTPFTVLPPEQKETVQVGPLELSIRPDRIDRVDEGFVLIDYKTSFALSTADWLGERPQAPQLPLYALLGDTEEIRGLAFARLRPGKAMTWLSLEDQPGLFSKKRGDAVHDITGQIELWREELDRLAEDFAAGRSAVNPKTYPHTCQYCQQRLLCRLDAAALLANAHTGPEPAPETAEAPATKASHG